MRPGHFSVNKSCSLAAYVVMGVYSNICSIEDGTVTWKLVNGHLETRGDVRRLTARDTHKLANFLKIHYNDIVSVSMAGHRRLV